MINPNEGRDPLAITLGVGSFSVAVLSLLGVGLITLITAYSLLTGNSPAAQSSWTLIVLLLSLAALSIPGVFFGFKHRRAYVANAKVGPPVQAGGLVILFGLVLLSGSWLLRSRGILSWLSPFMHVFAAGIPVLIAIYFVIRRGEPISLTRTWGSFLSGLWLAPLVALIFEITLAIPLLIVIFLGTSNAVDTPGLLEGLAQFPGNPDTLLLEQLNSLLNQPLVVAGILGYLSVVVPIIEEIAKSLGTWFLTRRKLTPSLAFVGGTLSGAAYGLFEALFLAQPGGEWMGLMIGRAGATMMHMFTAGLTGLGIYCGVKERRWGKAALFYAAAIILHGVWNIAALGIGLEDLAQVVANPIVNSDLSRVIAQISSGFLLILTLSAAVGLWKIPGRLRRDQADLEGGSVEPG